MPKEIERKFLLNNTQFLKNTTPTHLKQAYITTGPPASVRIRITDDSAILNIKQSTLDIARDEFEYEIPLPEAQHLLDNLCQGHTIEKNRYTIDYQGHTWEIDQFLGQNQGLHIAEIELQSEDQPFPHPPWLGQEVSKDKHYFNTYLAKHPYTTWPDK